jgi:hypothetical protein
LTITGYSRNVFSVSWTAPPEPVTSYIIKYKRDVDTIWTSIINITTTNRSLSSLTANTTYNIIVNSVNAIGTSLDSTQINPKTLNGTFSITQVSSSILPSNAYSCFISADTIFYSVGYNDNSNINLKKSTDYGSTWTSLSAPSTGFINRGSIVENNNVIYLGSNGNGIIRFNESWSTTLTNTSGMSIGSKNMVISKSKTIQRFFSSSNGQYFIINTPHTSNQVKQFSNANVPTNSLSSCGTDDLSTVYVGSTTGLIHKVSINWGNTNASTSLSCTAGIRLNSSDTTFIRGLACSSNGTIVYACTGNNKIYKSTNSGSSFSELANSPFGGHRSLACSSDGNVVVVCRFNQAIHISDNGGVNWTSGTIIKDWTSVDISSDGTKLIAGENFIWVGTVS